jgi:hypothetical protein
MTILSRTNRDISVVGNFVLSTDILIVPAALIVDPRGFVPECFVVDHQTNKAKNEDNPCVYKQDFQWSQKNHHKGVVEMSQAEGEHLAHMRIEEGRKKTFVAIREEQSCCPSLYLYIYYIIKTRNFFSFASFFFIFLGKRITVEGIRHNFLYTVELQTFSIVS